MDNYKEIKLKTDFIKASQLLKLSNIVSQGSDSKKYILNGFVKLNGEIIYERGKKIYPGNILTIKIDNTNISIKVVK